MLSNVVGASHGALGGDEELVHLTLTHEQHHPLDASRLHSQAVHQTLVAPTRKLLSHSHVMCGLALRPLDGRCSKCAHCWSQAYARNSPDLDELGVLCWIYGDAEMIGQYVLLLVTVVLGTIAGGVAIGCRSIRDWSWMVLVGALIFLGAAAMLAVGTPRVPGNVPGRSARMVRPPAVLRASARGSEPPRGAASISPARLRRVP